MGPGLLGEKRRGKKGKKSDHQIDVFEMRKRWKKMWGEAVKHWQGRGKVRSRRDVGGDSVCVRGLRICIRRCKCSVS